MSERERDDGGPAFPQPCDMNGNAAYDAQWSKPGGGMSLRDWLAGQALVGIIQAEPDWGWQQSAEQAYLAADAMLAARKKQ